MKAVSRRSFIGLVGKSAAGSLLLTVPQVLYRSPWLEAAAAQTAPHVRADFIALVEAVTTVPDEKVADWIIHEFDKALPPLPEGSPSAAVASILDSRTAALGKGVTFAQASPDDRRDVLESLVKDPDPAMRQLANQIIPFSSFAFYSDAALDEPARPGGPRREVWDQIDWPGPSHGYIGSFRDDSPAGFRAHKGKN